MQKITIPARADHPSILCAALPYANGPLHIGHLYEQNAVHIRAQALGLLGRSALRSCCSDAHGAPAALAAARLGIEPAEHCRNQTASHGHTLHSFGLWQGAWGNTHCERNRELSEQAFAEAQRLGLIFSDSALRPFCPATGAAQPDRFIAGACPACAAPANGGEDCPRCQAPCPPEKLLNPVCASSGLAPEFRPCESLRIDIAKAWNALGLSKADLYRLAGPAFQAKAAEWLENPQPIDICRPAPYFGWPAPGYPGLAFQVWWDAHLGYLSSIPESEIAELRAGRRSLRCCIGKDIARFHLTLFPVQLRLLGLPLPEEIQIHGFVVAPDGQKFSKSLGNAPDTDKLLEFGPEPVRLALGLLYKNSPDDAKFDPQSPKSIWNARVAGGVANLAARSLALLPAHESALREQQDFPDLRQASLDALELCALGRCAEGLDLALRLAEAEQKRFAAAEPWKAPLPAKTAACLRARGAALYSAQALACCCPGLLGALQSASPKQIAVPRIP